jgi:DNA-binding response OmpR family regulator
MVRALDHPGFGGSSALRRGAPLEKPLRILVVDDERVIREVLAYLLTDEGHEVVTAADGSAALKKFSEGTWDAVITDRVMPEMSGEELAAEIKKRSATTPVIMVTGFLGARERVGVQSAAIDLVITKPFTLSGILEGIQQVLPRKVPAR